MKIVTTAIFMTIAFGAAAQKDSTWRPASDTVEFISVRDMQEVQKNLGDKISMNDGQKMTQYFQTLINTAIERKRKIQLSNKK